MNAPPAIAPAAPRPLYASVLCVADGSDRGAATMRQAGLLAGTGAAFELVETPDDARELLASCAGHDLLVLPPGRLAREVLPRAPIPVLVARPAPEGQPVTGSVLVAVDETPAAHAAARLGARLAARDGSLVALVAAPEHDAAHQHALREHVTTVERVAGRTPLVLDEHGAAAPAIVRAAASLEASLIVLGSRPGRQDGSISAAVAEAASCSVLVLRPGVRQG